MNKWLKSLAVALWIVAFSPAVLQAQMLQAPELPPDNLISNPWFRDPSTARGSYDGWEAGPEWSLSRKNPNPTPDDMQGTAARIGQPDGIPGVDSFISTVVAADPGHVALNFQTWYVSLNLDEARATIYGSDSPEGPWVEVWQPWSLNSSTKSWMHSPLLHTTLDRGYAYYKIEFMCNYSGGVAGCKFTGVYFATAGEGEAAAAINTATIEPPAPVEETAEVVSGSDQTATGNTVALQATAVSPDQIELTWTALGDQTAYTIQRRLEGRGAWDEIAVVHSVTTYSDVALEPGTTYFYRMRTLSPGGQPARSDTVSAVTPALPAATESLTVAATPAEAAVSLADSNTPAPAGTAPANREFERQPAPWSAPAGYWLVAGIAVALLLTWLVIRVRRSA